MRSFLVEALAAAKSQPITSAITVLTVVGMVIAVMLTTGRSVGAEQRVLSSIDSKSSRAITVRATASSGLDATVLNRIALLSGVEWVGAFSLAFDVTNSAVTEGTKLPLRLAYGPDVVGIGVDPAHPHGPYVWASQGALTQLGLPDTAGAVQAFGGQAYSIAGRIAVPEPLEALEPLVLSPGASEYDPVALVIVVADYAEGIAPISAAVTSMLGVDDPTTVSVETSEALVSLRGVVEGQLGSFARGLVLALLVLMACVVAVLQYGLVMMRRKDFGRRRALGATRAFVFMLLVVQVALLSLCGIVIGTSGSLAVLFFSGDALPAWSFVGAVGVLAFLAAVCSALLPAIVASRRDPIRELRVP